MEPSARKTNRGARGRIAEVIADARASLKDPSRPFTPAGLDARMSADLDRIMALDRKSKNLSSNSFTAYNNSRASYDSAVSKSAHEFSVPKTAIRVAEICRQRDPTNQNREEVFQPIESLDIVSSAVSANDVLLAVCFLRDALLVLDSPDTDEPDESTVRQVCQSINDSIDTIINFFKSEVDLDSAGDVSIYYSISIR